MPTQNFQDAKPAKFITDIERSRYTRRDFLKLGALGMTALTFPAMLRAPSSDMPAGLKKFIKTQMRAAHLPGLAFGVVIGDQLVKAKGFGKMNLETNIRATADTLFMLASVSKTITAIALMQLFDAGKFGLDDDVNPHLPFAARNPNFPNNPITFRQLLTHTSSIRDNWNVLSANYVQGDSPISLHDFLAGYLVAGGAYYNLNKNFHTYAPSEEYDYSNIGTTLLGYLVETISGVPFDTYCNQNIFAPLNMTATSWRLRDLDQAQIAMPYQYRAGTNDYEALGHYGYPDYPDGLLRTSIVQLARVLIMFMNDGMYQATRLLQASTVHEMRRVQFPDIDATQGLIWYYDQRNGDTLLGHDGGDQGVATSMFYRPADKVGVLLVANSDGTPEEPFLAIQDKLFETYHG